MTTKASVHKNSSFSWHNIYHLIITGSTGFDSEINEMVSTSCNGIETRKRLDRTLNGENNYALAA